MPIDASGAKQASLPEHQQSKDIYTHISMIESSKYNRRLRNDRIARITSVPIYL